MTGNASRRGESCWSQIVTRTVEHGLQRLCQVESKSGLTHTSRSTNVSQLNNALFFQLLLFILRARNQSVEPSSKSEGGFADLQFHDWNSTNSIPICAEIGVVSYSTVYVVAIPFVALLGPSRCALLWRGGVAAGKPHVRGLVELVFSNARN